MKRERRLDEKLPHYLEALRELVAVPTVSARNQSIPEGAETVAAIARRFGLQADLHYFDGVPYVIASHRAGEGRPALLFYNHFDVQPEDPLELWETPPFDMAEKDGKLYGRGVCDDKGHIIVRFAAFDLLAEELGEVPLNLLFLAEGEEEIGSPHIREFLREKADLLRAEGCIWESGGVTSRGRPELYMGMKGVMSLELLARGPKMDVHSSLGPIVPNPLWRLVDFLREIKDADDRIRIPDFYADVLPPDEKDIKALSEGLEEIEELKENLGLEAFLRGAEGLEAKRRLFFEPWVNINGIHGGYGGEGSKTVLPSEARAKLDIRLVPNQKPEVILEKLLYYRYKSGYSDIEIEVSGGVEGPAKTPIDDPFVRLVADSAEEVYGEKPLLIPIAAGSGPMAHFREILGVPIVGCGMGYPGSRIHSPNENVRIEDFKKAILHTARVIEKFASIS